MLSGEELQKLNRETGHRYQELLQRATEELKERSGGIVDFAAATRPSGVVESGEETSTQLYVLEAYRAVQGEGLFVGAPTVFTRLSGCTVGCKYCDTKYSWKIKRGTTYTPYDLAKHSNELAHPYRRIALTGGEPLEHPWPLVAQFLYYCRALSLHVTIETSGVFFPDVLEQFGAWAGNNLWSVAPKLSMAGANYSFPDLLPWVHLAMHWQDQAVQFKLVVATNDDVDEAFDRMEYEAQRDPRIRDLPIFLQPATEYNEKDPQEKVSQNIVQRTIAVQDYVLSKGYFARWSQFFVRPQMHAILYGAKRQV